MRRKKCSCNRFVCEMYYRKAWNKRFVKLRRSWDEVVKIICTRCDNPCGKL